MEHLLMKCVEFDTRTAERFCQLIINHIC